MAINRANESKNEYPWKNDAEDTYEDFLEHSDPRIRQMVDHNADVMKTLSWISSSFSIERLFTRETPKSRIHVEATTLDILGDDNCLYGSKVTLRNMKDLQLKVEFDNTMRGNQLLIKDYHRCQHRYLQIASRSIVPSEFRAMSVRSTAGPMGFNEYILDGTHYPKNATLTLRLSAAADKDTIRIFL